MSEPIVGEKRRGNAGKGRPKGSANKATASVKDALTAAFDGMGGTPTLITWGEANPAAFYKLWAKMLPTDVKADVNLHVTKIVSEIVRASDTNR